MIYTAHIGTISPERQACVDRQKEVYGTDWMICNENNIAWDIERENKDGKVIIDPSEFRIDCDRYRLELIKDGGGWLDSDVYPNEAWQPTEDGIWLCHSLGRLDYWAIFNHNRNDYIQAMLEWYDNSKGKPAFMWPLAYFKSHTDGIKLIPEGIFEHRYLTTRKAKDEA